MLTHYQASWTDLKDYTRVVHYPGKFITDEEKRRYAHWNQEVYTKAVIESHFKQVPDVAHSYGLPVYCGKFGRIDKVPEADKTRWYMDMIDLFDQYGIARANWDYKGGFSFGSKDVAPTPIFKILTQGGKRD